MFENKAYTELIEPHRAELRAHCIRLLGSADDADDAVQEAMLRAWRALPRFEGRGPARAWLYRIATNTTLDEIRRRSRAPTPAEAELLDAASAGHEPDYERREAVELALLAAHRLLPASQRAVLVLREVLGFSARETAERLGRTETAVHSALQRARAKVDSEPPALDREQGLRSLPDRRLRAKVRRYADIWERGDVDALAAILAREAGAPAAGKVAATVAA